MCVCLCLSSAIYAIDPQQLLAKSHRSKCCANWRSYEMSQGANMIQVDEVKFLRNCAKQNSCH